MEPQSPQPEPANQPPQMPPPQDGQQQPVQPQQPVYQQPVQPQHPGYQHPGYGPLPPVVPPKKSQKTVIIVAATVGAVVLLCCGVVTIVALASKDDSSNSSSHEGGNRAPAPRTGSAAPQAKQAQDVTAKFKDTSLANPTIGGNDQWEPVINHINAVDFYPSDRSYAVLLDVPSEDARHALPGMLMDLGVAACMSVQFYDSANGTIEVFGNDGKKAAEARGKYGICQIVP
jgi:hypothetical protein